MAKWRDLNRLLCRSLPRSASAVKSPGILTALAGCIAWRRPGSLEQLNNLHVTRSPSDPATTARIRLISSHK